MNTPEVNIPLLRKAVEWAEAEAAKPDIESQWWQEYYVVRADEVGRDCGTCYCIAGYVGAQLDDRFVEEGFDQATRTHVEDFATQALGLTLSQRQALFDADNTIADVRRIAEDIAGERL